MKLQNSWNKIGIANTIHNWGWGKKGRGQALTMLTLCGLSDKHAILQTMWSNSEIHDPKKIFRSLVSTLFRLITIRFGTWNQGIQNRAFAFNDILRSSWNDYFLDISKQMLLRSTNYRKFSFRIAHELAIVSLETDILNKNITSHMETVTQISFIS